MIKKRFHWRKGFFGVVFFFLTACDHSSIATGNKPFLTEEYTNNVFLFGFSYPSSWFIQESSGFMTDGSSVTVVKKGRPSKKTPYISIQPRNGSFASLREWKAAHEASTMSLVQVTIGGLPGLHGTEIYSQPDGTTLAIESYYLERNGMLYGIYPYYQNSQNHDEMQSIVQSFHFIEH